jgi:hypothetical protein
MSSKTSRSSDHFLCCCCLLMIAKAAVAVLEQAKKACLSASVCTACTGWGWTQTGWLLTCCLHCHLWACGCAGNIGRQIVVCCILLIISGKTAGHGQNVLIMTIRTWMFKWLYDRQVRWKNDDEYLQLDCWAACYLFACSCLLFFPARPA